MDHEILDGTVLGTNVENRLDTMKKDDPYLLYGFVALYISSVNAGQRDYLIARLMQICREIRGLQQGQGRA